MIPDLQLVVFGIFHHWSAFCPIPFDAQSISEHVSPEQHEIIGAKDCYGMKNACSLSVFFHRKSLRNLLTSEAMPRVASQKKDDVLSSSVEANWFNAWEHIDEMKKYCADWRGHRWLQVLDVFSYGQGMRAVVGTMACTSYDIRLDRKRHDITTRRGVFLLLGLGLCLAHGGLITCAPPCSMSIYLSCSVHMRHLLGPLGNTANFKVRLSNRIVLNMARVSPKQFLDFI